MAEEMELNPEQITAVTEEYGEDEALAPAA